MISSQVTKETQSYQKVGPQLGQTHAQPASCDHWHLSGCAHAGRGSRHSFIGSTKHATCVTDTEDRVLIDAHRATPGHDVLQRILSASNITVRVP